MASSVATTTEKRSADGETSNNKKSKREQKVFFNAWLEDPEFKSWLIPVPNNSKQCKCKVCNSTLVCGKSELQKHAKTNKHISNMRAIKSVPSIVSLVQKKEPTLENKVKAAEIKLAAFFAEHNVALSIADHLVPLCTEIFEDSKIAQQVTMKRTKCTSIVKNVLATVENAETINYIKNVPFSVLLDESTDISVTKFMCVLVRYVCPVQNTVRTELLELIPLDASSCSAASLYGAFKKSLQDKEIPVENIVGVASDGASVMVGARNSFFSHLRDDAPNVVLLPCICHSAALVASKACEKLSGSAEELLRAIYNYISGSAKRCKQLIDIQEFFHAERLKVLKPSNTRWLAMHQCICRVLEIWPALEHFFLLAVVEDKLKSAEFILTHLQNGMTKANLLFLKYSLNFFNTFNVIFQSRNIIVHKLSEESEKILKQICQNFMKKEAIKDVVKTNCKNPSNFVQLNSVYLGPECENLLKTFPPNLVEDFRKRCLDFYSEAAQEMQKRLPLDKPIFKELAFIDPNVALHYSGRDLVPNIVTLAELYKTSVNLTALNVEWQQLPHSFSDKEKTELLTMPVDTMWCKIAETTDFNNRKIFPNLGYVAKLALTFPHSNAEAERIFSIVNDTKTKKRNRLSDSTLNAVAIVRSCFQSKGINCNSFQVKHEHLKLHNTKQLYDNDEESPPGTSDI